jgi:hypothetical protein
MFDDPWTAVVLAFAGVGVLSTAALAWWQRRWLVPLGMGVAAVALAPSWVRWGVAGVVSVFAVLALGFKVLRLASAPQPRAMVVIAALMATLVAVALAR